MNIIEKKVLDLRSLPSPEPTPNKKEYDEERAVCLSLDKRKNENYQKYLQADRSVDVSYLPIKLDIEPVSRCNFRCTMCQVSEWPKMKRARDMTLDEFKGLIDDQYGLVEIKLQGMGEPLMNAEPFFEMIKYARQRRIWVRVTVNASLLHIKDNYKKLIDSGVNEVQISIDGATQEVFESIRRGSTFSQVIKNCETINSYCTSLNLIKTKMWTVVRKANFHQLIDLVYLASKIGFKSQVFSLNLSDFGQGDWREKNDSVTVDKLLDMESANKLIDLGFSLGVNVSFWCVTSKYSSSSSKTVCPWPFERAFIASDMRTVPCCMIANPDVLELGIGKSFSEAWNGEDYKKFRDAHLKGNIPLACKSCYESKN